MLACVAWNARTVGSPGGDGDPWRAVHDPVQPWNRQLLAGDHRLQRGRFASTALVCVGPIPVARIGHARAFGGKLLNLMLLE